MKTSRTSEDRAPHIRLLRERKIQRDRASAAHGFIKRNGNCGIVALEGASVDYFLDGLEGKAGRGHVKRLPAYGNVQGPDKGDRHAQNTLEEISKHRREYGQHGILALVGFNFRETASIGTPQVTRRFMDLLDSHSHNNPREVGVVVVGEGALVDLDGAPGFPYRDHHPINSLLVARYAVMRTNELTTDPFLRPEHLTAGQPVNLLPPLREDAVQNMSSFGQPL
jgi:hypothetical protein